jgi:energy-coupling factor transporter ATP-binding protein EcfA2
MPSSKRLHHDPWSGKRRDRGGGFTASAPIDFVGREYADKVFDIEKENLDTLRRDALIESIMELDQSRHEYVRRLIIEESRLDVLMRILGYRAPEHQMLINSFLQDRQYGLVLAPRGSGKSTCANVCYSIMKALQNRDIRILIASRTTQQAQSFLSEIKANLLKPALTDIFGELRGEKWDETQADIVGRTHHTKEHTFTIAGADGAVVSKHFDEIIADDLVELKNSRTDTQRAHLVRFIYTSLLPTLRPNGNMRILGTRYHPEDLYGYLISNDPKFKHSYFVLPAVFDKETGEVTDLLQDEDGKFYAPPNAQCWDPEGFPMKKVIERRSSMPLADFECQYQNRTKFLSGNYFKSIWFRHYDADPISMIKQHDLAVWMGVDLAVSLKDDADEFAIVVVGIIPKIFEIYVLYEYASRLTFTQQKAQLVNVNDMFSPLRVFVEANAYQAVLESTVATEWPDIPTRPIWTTKDKITRARAIQLYYERKQVFHRKGRMAALEAQLTGFPDLKLKDRVDALYFAINGALQGGARKRRSADREPGLF